MNLLSRFRCSILLSFVFIFISGLLFAEENSTSTTSSTQSPSELSGNKTTVRPAIPFASGTKSTEYNALQTRSVQSSSTANHDSTAAATVRTNASTGILPATPFAKSRNNPAYATDAGTSILTPPAKPIAEPKTIVKSKPTTESKPTAEPKTKTDKKADTRESSVPSEQVAKSTKPATPESLRGTKKTDAPDSKVKDVKDAPSKPMPLTIPTQPPKADKTIKPAQKQPNTDSASAKETRQSVTAEKKEPSEGKAVSQAPLFLSQSQGEAGILPAAGYPNAATAVSEMYNDIVRGMNTRQVTPLYQQWRRYCAQVLARTNALNTGNELNNRCRLSWYDKLYRNPLTTVSVMEEYSQMMYSTLGGSAYAMILGIRDARVKMDVSRSEKPIRVPIAHSPDEAVEILKTTLEEIAVLQKKSVAALTEEEKNFIARDTQSVFCSQIQNGHTLPNIPWAKYIIDLLEKMDKAALYDATEAMITLTDEAFLNQLAKLDPSKYEEFEQDGKKFHRIKTEAGYILIGDKNNTEWNLDSFSDIVCVIDLGGDDTYQEGICNIHRPVFMVLDLGKGNDQYTGSRMGIQGGAVLGVTLWYNQGGNNTYRARDVAQGSAIGGAGILIDNGGDDTYLSFLRGQGHAICGLGMLIDRSGADDYHAAMLAQGLGNPGGFAVLLDKSGNDHYYVGGYFPDSYEEHPGYDGWGQGLGAGIRQVACGGIGLLLEGEGDDTYEYDYFAHGGGYWMGIGLIRDFAGDDKRPAATSREYNGGPRQQGIWQRFSCGFGCHYALGYCFDDRGNDTYNGTIMGSGMGWDLAAGFLVDFDGDDMFTATQGLTQGCGAEGSIGVIMEYRGNNTYYGASQGYAGGNLTYHSAMDCGANFSFVVDHGGKDVYGNNAQNNTMSQSGMPTGFIIDRPTATELAEMEKEKQEALAKAKAEKEAQDEALAKARQAGIVQPAVAQPAPQQMQQQYPQPQYQNNQQRYPFMGRGYRGR